MPTHWTAKRGRGSAFAIWLIKTIALGLGRPPARLLLYPITLYYVLTSPRAVRVSRLYLARALDRPARAGDVFRHYFTFAASLLDRLYILADRFRYFDFRYENRDALVSAVEEGRGCVLLGAHLGSFDVMRAMAEKDRMHVAVRVLMYRDGRGRNVERALEAVNPDLKASVIPVGDPAAMLQVKETVDAGEMVGVLGDRALPGDKTVTCEVLGDPVELPLGPMLLALALGVPVVLCLGLYEGGGRYRLVFERFGEGRQVPREEREAEAARLARLYAERLSHYCRQAPYNWFNLYDYWSDLD